METHHDRHDLRVQILDTERVRVSLAIDDIHAAGFLTAQDVMGVLGCSSSQLSQLVRAGRLMPTGGCGPWVGGA